MAVNNIGNDFYNNMLGNSFTSSSTSSSGMLGDYALIKSGSYKKLLNAYYTKENKTSASEDTISTKEKNNLVNAKSAADKLKEQADLLKKLDYTEANKDNIKKNLESFISAYNSMIDDGAEVDNNQVLKNTLWMTQVTKANSKLLSEIGIKVDKNNKLSLDEETFGKAHMTTMSTLFKGAGSFADKILTKASRISTVAGEVAAKGDKPSNYTKKGENQKVENNVMVDEKA